MQGAVVIPAGTLHQIQAHRFAIRRRGIILPRIAGMYPQHTRRRYPHDLALRLQHAMAPRQLAQAPLPALALLPRLPGPPGKILDATLLPGADTDSLAGAGLRQQPLNLLAVEELPAPARQTLGGLRVGRQSLGAA